MGVTLVYVDSPFQLLQYVEYLNRFANENIKLVIRYNCSFENDRQLDNLVNLFQIKIFKIFKFRSSRIGVINFLAILFIVLGSKKVVFGDSNSLAFKFFRNFFFRSSITLLDDGVGTLNSKKAHKKYKRFSIFKGIVKNTTHNDFQFLSSIVAKKNFSKVKIIVGAKLVEELIVEQKVYFKLIQKIIDNLDLTKGSNRLIYIPHREESEESLIDLSNKFNIEIIRLALPIELIGLECNLYPESISSVISTALFSMKLLYPNSSVFVCPINESDLLNRKAAIKNLYLNYKNYKVGNFI